MANDASKNLGDLASILTVNGGAATINGLLSANTPTAGDNSTKVATTAFVTSGFAPIASPTFTGDPKAPTPALFDNDTSIATTAFVKANSSGIAGITTVSTNTTLDTTHANKLIVVSGTSGAITLTLPSAATYSEGSTIRVTNISSNSCSVARAGTDTINSAITSLAIGVGDTLVLTRGSSSTTWIITDGTANLINCASFGSSLAATGYQKLPSGLILQWGKAASGGSGTITYPISFPTAVVCINLFDTIGTNLSGITITTSTIGWTGSGSVGPYWFAIGY